MGTSLPNMSRHQNSSVFVEELYWNFFGLVRVSLQNATNESSYGAILTIEEWSLTSPGKLPK
jgi:hypothetical protein